ncbi:hypothetical protein, partial [Bradyrhizobium sp. NBAIM08]|uniref:hypothetical protein n=1 Tax=Bradyrhizobium sp. NBAIM08 TaxID=2793815 RepID=UPI001CD62BFA
MPSASATAHRAAFRRSLAACKISRTSSIVYGSTSSCSTRGGRARAATFCAICRRRTASPSAVR